MARLVSSETYRAELEGHDPQDHAPVPGTIERVLELIDARPWRRGGLAARPRSHTDELQALRRRIESSP